VSRLKVRRIVTGKEHGMDVSKDVARFREEISELSELTDSEIEELYREWSSENHCAGWLSVTDRAVRVFRNWVTKSPMQLKLEEREEDEGD